MRSVLILVLFLLLFVELTPAQTKSLKQPAYYDPVNGKSLSELIRSALTSNGELAAVRIELERARARIHQAQLRPNPTLEVEQTTGRFTNSASERETSFGLAVPIELGGKRKRRIELAEVELEAARAEIAERERQLASEVTLAYVEALTSLRELETTNGIHQVDLETTRFVQARVNEGESAPLELNLLRAEVDRLRARRTLVEGRLTGALVYLKLLAGISDTEPLRLREDLVSFKTPAIPSSREVAVELALRSRADLRLARVHEAAAEAGLKLVRASAFPGIVAFTRYKLSRSAIDDTPVGPLSDRDRTLAFGISIDLPLFNRNQGAQAEAAALISQTRKRREYLEQVIRSEVQRALVRYEVARAAAITFEQGVIGRSTENLRVLRSAYELGQFQITDLLAEQRRLLDSHREFTETLAEKFRASSDLQTALGIAPEQK